MQLSIKTLLIHPLWFSVCVFVAMHSYADTDLSFMKPGITYAEARKKLTEQGWKPIKNGNIRNASLYAQEVYDEGLVEVTDCVSMALDACTFRLMQKRLVLEVKTITKQRHLDSFKTYQKR